MKYTPGPWKLVPAYRFGLSKEPDAIRDDRVLVAASMQDGDAAIALLYRDNDTDEANARLIKAAPELAEFLSHFMATFDSLNPYMTAKRELTPDQINALIKKGIALKGKLEGYI